MIGGGSTTLDTSPVDVYRVLLLYNLCCAIEIRVNLGIISSSQFLPSDLFGPRIVRRLSWLDSHV